MAARTKPGVVSRRIDLSDVILFGLGSVVVAIVLGIVYLLASAWVLILLALGFVGLLAGCIVLSEIRDGTF